MEKLKTYFSNLLRISAVQFSSQFNFAARGSIGNQKANLSQSEIKKQISASCAHLNTPMLNCEAAISSARSALCPAPGGDTASRRKAARLKSRNSQHCS
jgi:hypothetical protein